MNIETNTTEEVDAPAKRSMKLQLLGIYDLASEAGRLVDMLDMAASAIGEGRQRNAMADGFDVLVDRMEALKEAIEAAREDLA